MKAKKWMALALAGCLSVGLLACGSAPSVYVQSVAQLMGYEGIAPGDRFSGVVVSEYVAEIQKDGDRTVEELMVKEGDDVKEGDPLFAYDTEELQLTLEKQRLELDQMKASITSYENQIQQLEKELNRVSGNSKLQYTIQIQTTQVDLKETQLKMKTKEAEVKKSEDILENATITSPVTGRVQAINDSGTSQEGEPAPYITIQKTGAYRVKGVLGELQRGTITEGTRIRILSRTNPDQTWAGTVSVVDFENPIKKDNYMMGPGGDSDEMTNSSQYPFYIKLDSTDGLMMGQHVYLELDNGDGEAFDLFVDGAFLMKEENGKTYVWAENGRSKLEKREVTLGRYNEMLDVYEITDGLTKDDYIAFPDATCVAGAVTSHEPVENPDAENDMGGGEGEIMPDVMPDMDGMGGMEGMEEMPQEDMGSQDGMTETAGGEEMGAETEPAEAGAEAPASEAETTAATAEGGV